MVPPVGQSPAPPSSSGVRLPTDPNPEPAGLRPAKVGHRSEFPFVRSANLLAVDYPRPVRAKIPPITIRGTQTVRFNDKSVVIPVFGSLQDSDSWILAQIGEVKHLNEMAAWQQTRLCAALNVRGVRAGREISAIESRDAKVRAQKDADAEESEREAKRQKLLVLDQKMAEIERERNELSGGR
jgi:hypothetical protein